MPLEPKLYTCRKYLRILSSELSFAYMRNYSQHLFNILNNIITLYEMLKIRSYNRSDFRVIFNGFVIKCAQDSFVSYARDDLVDDSFWLKFKIMVLMYIINENKIIEYYMCQCYIHLCINTRVFCYGTQFVLQCNLRNCFCFVLVRYLNF